jgi:endonuclease-3
MATATLFAKHPTPQALLELEEAELLEFIRTIGLAPTKVRNILSTCRILLERHDGEVPRSREALEELPGVGRKTANVVLNVAFGMPTIAVDTHVFRIGNRTGLAPGKNVREVEEALLRITPRKHKLHAHHYLILHGRYVCKARKPDCGRCVIAKECEYPGKIPAP